MIGVFLLFTSLNLSNLTPSVDVSKIADSAGANVSMEVASDLSFSQKTLNFGSGQTVYVRIVTDNDGAGKHSLGVHDSDYNLLSSYQMNRLGNQFTVSFPAPKTSGTYSLEADIESGGSVLNLVKTISVGEGGSSSSVNVENRVGERSQNLAGSPSPTDLEQDPSPTPAASIKVGKQNFFLSIWQQIAKFFSHLI